MKYRIVEFKVPQPGTGNRFFVDTGTLFWKKVVAFIYWPSILWEHDEDEENKPLGHKTFKDAMERIEEIKLMQPVIHQIK
ncbi:hypothetical protein UFOVP1596_44 [uncultured Caudovirales phage]|uniref:Uncharacterized protein n=1 Tax=uncultured Caudovirales phage TaxID=2100421 RepID=A0A6J5SW02_9CAUD|nr:hypothetical protein UFOVP1596_44 [uncultured Caudovirales phage]